MMNTGGSPATQQYQQIGTKSEVESASPHRLIQLMMERVLAKIAMARGYIDRENVSEKGAAIGVAISIIDGLRVSLNYKTDATLASNFDALYDYMTRRLLEANVKNDPKILVEVSDLMREIKEAWDAISDQVERDSQSGSPN